MRGQLRRSFPARLKLVFAVALILSGSLPALTGWAQDSGAATFTVASANGNVVIKRANGTSEMARAGTQLYANDQLASVGRSEAMLNAVGPGNTSGASLLLYSDTTIGVRGTNSVPNSAGAGTFYVADIAQGVVVARTPPNSGAALQITAESAQAVAQVNPGGGMAVASDVGTGTIAVACEDRQSQVFFPYVDDRVPCENNVVRTLSNNRTVEDSRADANSPITAAVQAAGTNVAAAQQAENASQSQGAANRSNTQQDDEDDVVVVAASPAPGHGGPLPTGPGQPCNSSTVSGGQGVTVTTHELGQTSGTFTFTYNAQFQPDLFEIFYEGQLIFTTGGPVPGSATRTVTYSGASTQIVVRVTGPETGTLWSYIVSCPAGVSTPTPTPTSPPSIPTPTFTPTPTPTPTSVAGRATSVSVTCDAVSCTAFVFASDGASPAPTGQVSFAASPAGRTFAPNPCTLSSSGSPPNVSSCTVTMSGGGAATITATYLPGTGFSSSTGFTSVGGGA